MKPAPPRVSPAVMHVFAAYTRRYVRKHFHSLRVLERGLPASDRARPLVIYLNHASWWDPLVCLLLSREFFADRTSFAPIDAPMLERYGVFRHLGFFGVEQDTRGAFTFLRTASALLASSQHVVWLTPQGRFVDVRERPLRLKGGLGALATREPSAAFIPLAIEFSFWTESRPEILVSFGELIIPGDGPARSADEWTRTFTSGLEATQDELAARSCRRDASEWRTLSRGRSGVGGFYDAWRRVRARVRGEAFAPEHCAEVAR